MTRTPKNVIARDLLSFALRGATAVESIYIYHFKTNLSEFRSFRFYSRFRFESPVSSVQHAVVYDVLNILIYVLFRGALCVRLFGRPTG